MKKLIIILSIYMATNMTSCGQNAQSKIHEAETGLSDENMNNTDRGLCTYDSEKNEFTVEQNGKLLTIKSKLLTENPSYHYTYLVQNNLLIYQTSHDLYVIHFNGQGEIVYEFGIRNENHTETGVALYNDLAITAGLINDPTRENKRTYAVKYIDTKTQTLQTVNLLQSFGNRYADSRFAAEAKGLTVTGNTLYVLVQVIDFQITGSTFSGEYYIAEYDLDTREDIAVRITPVDLNAQAIDAGKSERETESNHEGGGDSAPTFKTPFMPKDEDLVMPTAWNFVCIGSSKKYLVLALRSNTSVYYGMSIGYMGLTRIAYLVYDRKNMQAIAFYPLNRGIDPYSALAIDGDVIYMFDWRSCTLHAFDMEHPTVKTGEEKDSFKFRGAINTYPAAGAKVVKTGFAERVAAKGTKAHRSHFSVINGALFYIAEDIYGKSFIESSPLNKR